MAHRWHLALALVAVCAAGSAVAADVVADTTTDAVAPAHAGRGSLQVFADDIARALQARAAEEGISGGVRLVLDDVRGLDGAKVKSSLLPRIRRALHGSRLDAKDNGPITATLAVSEEQGAVWAVLVLTGGALSGPSTVVVDTAIDRELELSLGAVSRLATGRFVLERSGPLPSPVRQQSCAVLDVVLVDLDGDPANELAVLSRCGIAVYRLDESSGPVLVAGPWPLPQRRWPRTALGWLTATSGQDVWVTTSAGHSLFVDVRTGKLSDAPAERVPLRGVVSKDGPLSLHWRFGSPVLSLPLMSPAGIDVVVTGLPSRVRDLARLQAADAWVFIADDGTLGLRDDAGTIEAVAPERVGDRLLVIDVDSDGEQEIVTSSSASPGEPDQLVVRRLTPGLDASTVLLKSPLGGGSIVGFASGHVDFDARLDVVVVEELQSGEATVWRLEHAP
jgi:hypothetical protein